LPGKATILLFKGKMTTGERWRALEIKPSLVKAERHGVYL
jgi:hypothetical protein